MTAQDWAISVGASAVMAGAAEGVLLGVQGRAAGPFRDTGVQPEAPGNATPAPQGARLQRAPDPVIPESGASVSNEAHAIGNGHADDKHVLGLNKQGMQVRESEFPTVRSKPHFAEGAQRIFDSPETISEPLSGGRTAYYHNPSNTLVIVNPGDADLGTMFRPSEGRLYFERLR